MYIPYSRHGSKPQVFTADVHGIPEESVFSVCSRLSPEGIPARAVEMYSSAAAALLLRPDTHWTQGAEIMQSCENRPVSCQRGQLTLRGHIFGSEESGKHAVILSHGFLANEKTVHAYARALAESGFVCVTFDFSGGGLGSRSDGRSENMTLLTEKEDLLAVIRSVRSSLKPSGISLLGCSQGGFVSALAAKELGKDEIRSLILFYPALCIPDDARRGHMMIYRFDPQHIPDILGRIPMKLGGDYARTVISMDPFEEICGYEGPVLLFHGTADNIVDVAYSRRARTVYPDCTYHEIPGAGHGFTGEHDREAIRLLLNFLQPFLEKG